MMMNSVVIAPRFSASEAEAIRKEVEKGKAKTRSEYVRFATRAYMEMKGVLSSNLTEETKDKE